jgi:tripartite-type tricarboxylate transporter receptor subunit TctC
MRSNAGARRLNQKDGIKYAAVTIERDKRGRENMKSQVRGRMGLAAALVSISLAATTTAAVAEYPERSIRVVVAIAAGSVTDVIARASAAELASRLGQQFVIENRGGANGIPAADACKSARPDGYTICLLNHGHFSFNPLQFHKLPYDPDTDFVPIAHLYFLIEGIFVPTSLGVNSIADLKALVQKNPGALNYGTLGPGSPPDLFRQWLNKEWGANIVGIPYRGGGPIAQALAANQIQLARMGIGNFLGLMQAGEVKALAATVKTPLLPNVPAIEDVGITFPGFGWWGMVAPKGTPQPIIDKLSAELIRQTKDAKFAAYLTRQAVRPSGMTPAEFAAFIKADRARAKMFLELANAPIREYKPATAKQ